MSDDPTEVALNPDLMYLDAYCHRVKLEKDISELNIGLAIARKREEHAKSKLLHHVDAEAHFAALKVKK